MFNTMYTYKSAPGSRTDHHSPTLPGQSKTVREMYEKYTTLGIPLPNDENGYFDSEIAAQAFGMELEDMQEHAAQYQELRERALKAKEQPQEQPKEQPQEQPKEQPKEQPSE